MCRDACGLGLQYPHWAESNIAIKVARIVAKPLHFKLISAKDSSRSDLSRSPLYQLWFVNSFVHVAGQIVVHINNEKCSDQSNSCKCHRC